MVNTLTFADIARPSTRKYALSYDVTLVIIASLLIAISAQISFWLPFSCIPVSAQPFAVLLIAALLGSKRGSLAVTTYLAQGAAGLPVFVSARAGLPVLFGPTGGYLFGFVLAAWIVGKLAEKKYDRGIGTTIVAMTLGCVAIYACGLAQLSFFMPAKALLVTGFYPFIAGDIFKIALASALLPAGWKILSALKR